MCGIATFFARESVPNYKHIDTIFKWSEKRGQDGFGVVVIPRKNNKTPESYYSLTPYSVCKDEVKEFVQTHLDVGSLVIAISRAAPETEPPSNNINILQPIRNANCILAHNGAVSNKIHRELQRWANESNDYQFKADNDSESIIASYVKHKGNMKDTMEFLSGGFAFVMYDSIKDMLYVVNDFKPLAHGYIRGVGFFITSDNDAIGEVLYDHLGVRRDGMFLWENYYHHYLSGYAIREIDLQSGFMRKESYSPRFKVGCTFDSNSEILEGK